MGLWVGRMTDCQEQKEHINQPTLLATLEVLAAGEAQQDAPVFLFPASLCYKSLFSNAVCFACIIQYCISLNTLQRLSTARARTSLSGRQHSVHTQDAHQRCQQHGPEDPAWGLIQPLYACSKAAENRQAPGVHAGSQTSAAMVPSPPSISPP